MKKLSSSKVQNTMIAFAAITGGALMAQSTGSSSASGCPSSRSDGQYCCAYTNGVVAASGKSTSSANNCCIDYSGKAGDLAYTPLSIGGKVLYVKVITYDISKYPQRVEGSKGKVFFYTSPCSFTQI
jgi:hypothetical protein